MEIRGMSIIFLLAAATELLLAWKTYKKNKNNISLILTFVMAAVTSVAYFLWTAVLDYFIMSICYSIYSIGIVTMLFFAAHYVDDFACVKKNPVDNVLQRFFMFYLIVDIIIMAINPFKELVFTYKPRTGIVLHYSRTALIAVHEHYFLITGLVVISFTHLLTRMIKAPSVYKGKYSNLIISIIITACLNVFFTILFWKDYYNLAVLMYCLCCIFMYMNEYHYVVDKMVRKVQMTVMDQLGHPVIVFDDENRFILCNKEAEFLIPERKNKEYSLKEFVEDFGGDEDIISRDSDFSFQWTRNDTKAKIIYRWDFRIIKDEKDKLVGKIFVLTDNSISTDLLTGFHNKTGFMAAYGDKKDEMINGLSETPDIKYPVSITACDLNGLSIINSKQGEEAGDIAIRKLADLMRKYCPMGTYFVRMNDANLVAIMMGMDIRETRTIFDRVKKELATVPGYDEPLGIQSAVYIVRDDGTSLPDGVKAAISGMRTKKMMDTNSAHSSLLDSLAQTLLESDSGTKSHVQRTKSMGDLLGRRLGLTDVQLGQVELLCLLHDIGKLGIPLEILNKPTKLNQEEWKLMQTHVEKGYRIAKASKELEGIADCILYHHEFWNGKGYPDGLKGENIPLLSRIISVVDAYDAMTNNRPYRNSIGRDAAIAELRRMAGIQFDPHIVSEFIQLLDELREKALRNRDDYEYYLDSLDEEIENESQDNKSDSSKIKTREADASKTTIKVGQVGDERQKSKNKDVQGKNGRNISMISSAGADEPRVRLLPLGAMEIDEDEETQTANTYLINYARYIFDDNWKILEISDNFEMLTGYSANDLDKYNLTHMDLLFPEDHAEYLELLGNELPKKGMAFVEHRLRRKDGSAKLVVCYGKKIYQAATKEQRSEIIVADMEEMHAMKVMIQKERDSVKRNLEQYQDLIKKDSLTGLFNHKTLMQEVEMKLLSDKQDILFMMMDVDKFKTYNDELGHHKGDELIIAFANALREIVGDRGFACRMGGDEFAAVIFVEKGWNYEQINQIVKGIWEHQTRALGEMEMVLTTSVGATVSNSMKATFRALYTTADKALYDVKDEGRNNYKLIL